MAQPPAAGGPTCRVCFCAEGELEDAAALRQGGADAAKLLYDACKCAEPIHRHCLQGWLAARDASTDGRRRCEVCDQPIALAERVCVEVPLPSAAVK